MLRVRYPIRTQLPFWFDQQEHSKVYKNTKIKKWCYSLVVKHDPVTVKSRIRFSLASPNIMGHEAAGSRR